MGTLKYKKEEGTCAVFKKVHISDAGYDLCTTSAITIDASSNALISSGISISIPSGWMGLLVGRSSLSTKKGCSLVTGVIDSEYHGTILMNVHNDNEFFPAKIKKGSRIAQLILLPIFTGDVEEVSSLDDTERGSNGFGSTGGIK